MNERVIREASGGSLEHTDKVRAAALEVGPRQEPGGIRFRPRGQLFEDSIGSGRAADGGLEFGAKEQPVER